jgi:hypothetical protein
MSKAAPALHHRFTWVWVIEGSYGNGVAVCDCGWWMPTKARETVSAPAAGAAHYAEHLPRPA